MKMNIGILDRSLRVLLGLALIALAFAGRIGEWGYLGAVPLLTAVIGVCPLYSMLGFSTCRIAER